MAISSTRKAFNEAFRSAADSGAKTFEFEGKSYSTKMAPPKTTSNRGDPLRANAIKRAAMKETERQGTFAEPYVYENMNLMNKNVQEGLAQDQGMKKGGMVKAKRTSHRGAGIATKGFGRAGGK